MPEYAAHLEIEPKVYLIRGLNKSRFPEANSILIDDEILTLIDAGSDKGQIESTLRSLGHELNELDRIVLTHFHIDHKGHAEFLRETSECEVLCHPLSDHGIETFRGMAEYYGISTHPRFSIWKSRIESWLPHVTGDYIITGHYTDRKPISCGEVEITPVHLPGHTVDHTCFGINGLQTIFLVDIDLTRFGPWYGNEVSDIRDFEKSIRTVIDIGPKVGISSHLLEPVVDNLNERLTAYLMSFEEREKRVLVNIAAGYDTIEKLANAPTIYPRIPDEVFLLFEEFMLRKHIDLLEKEGKLNENEGRFSIERK